jgi:hypothetical protein
MRWQAANYPDKRPELHVSSRQMSEYSPELDHPGMIDRVN